MVTEEERIKILKMLQEGKLSAEEAAQLLEALEVPQSVGVSGARAEGRPASSSKGGRWFRVRVTDTNSGKTRVNVRLPVSLITAGMKMGARFSPEVQGLDMDQLVQFIQSGETGQVVDVFDDEDGEHVEVFIE
jgi:hypothetical protein